MFFLQNATNQISQSLNPLQDIAKALHDADRTNTYLVFFTAILAISTILFGIWDKKRTRDQIRTSEQKQEERFAKQSKTQDDEHFERVRPWIVIKTPEPFQVEYAQRTEPYSAYIERPLSEQAEAEKVVLAFFYSNKGHRVAKDLKRIVHYSFKEFSKEEFENMEEKTLKMSLAPEQEQTLQIRIPYQDWIQLKQKPVFLAIRTSYDNGRYRSFSGGIYKFSNSGAAIMETWYT